MKKFLVPTALAAGLAVSAAVSIRPNIESFQRVDLIQPDESVDVVGYRTIYTMEKLIDTLLNKPGGYISNDVLPPFVFLDDMPAFELGAISVLRENAIVITRHFTRSIGTQSLEDKDAVTAQVNINIDTNSWIFPSAEGKYKDSRDAYTSLGKRLVGGEGNFYIRATSLRDALDAYNRILGNVSQKLSASVGGINLSAKPTGKIVSYSTPWLEIDDNFWEAMGTVWVLEELFDALEYDFASILKDKNAQLTVRQIREELKNAQAVVLSPYTQNNTNVYGISANHSIALANYISRANATIIDLKRLITDG